MPLETLIKLVNAVKFPLLAGCFGLLLNGAGSNNLLRNTGAAVTFLSIGSGVSVATRKDKHLREIKALTEKHSRELGSLKASADGFANEAARARDLASRRDAINDQLKDTIAELREGAEQSRLAAHRMRSEIEQAKASAATCHSDNSLLAGQLSTLEMERVQLIAELYETAVEEVDIKDAIAGLESQFSNRSAYELTQRKKLKSEITKARADLHTQLSESHERIEELETQLAEKTQLAHQMIDEINGDANGKLTQIGGKLGSQSEVIKALQLQLDESRKSVKALTFRRFDNVGTDNVFGNRLIDALAKRGSTYGAFHHEREGHNGRLKVWLTLIDAPLKRAQDALDDLEAELSLWAKPAVKVDRGMHLFTLATEQEHKKIERPADNLNRLEKDFDKANHIRIVGPTGSGKSTFLDNMIWLGRYLWPSAKMELLDPKAPFTVWQGGIVPDFKNMECVSAIANISERLQLRFNDANKVAENHGNDSDEFNQYVDELAPYIFILDEAQYLYRMAKKEDSKTSPKGKLANLVRDSLLDCLGVGRALKVKGYFITQSAKCAKLNMNDDDFDNATSIFLGSAIGNALDGELKGEFSDAKLSKVRAEYHHRKQLGQQYLALISYSESDTLYLIQCPQPGFYHARVLQAQTQVDPGAGTKVQNAEQSTPTDVQQGTEKEVTEVAPAAAPTPDPHCTHPKIITEGHAACTGCGTFSDTIRNGNVNSRGKVKFACKNKDCKKQIFSAVPIKNPANQITK